MSPLPVYQLSEDLVFPAPRYARRDGLLAVGGDLSPQRLLLAYSHGIFPWYSDDDPILWWSPDPRLLLAPSAFHVSKSLRRVLRAGVFRVSFDTAFREVIQACADFREPGRDGTWITGDMVEAYCELHRLGYAHSVECWTDEGLAGGLYGVSLGAAFFGESMFSRASNGSKVALATLAKRLEGWGFHLIDCQMTTRHLLSLGAVETPRARFLSDLARAVAVETRVGPWPSNA